MKDDFFVEKSKSQKNDFSWVFTAIKTHFLNRNEIKQYIQTIPKTHLQIVEWDYKIAFEDTSYIILHL